MRQEHARELKVRDDKITFLKKQISDSLKDNSWYKFYFNFYIVY